MSGRLPTESKQTNRVSQRGRYLAFASYSDSSCQKRLPIDRMRSARRTPMPAPTLSAPVNTERNIAKLSDTSRTPRSDAASASAATIASLTPLGAFGERRIRSSDSPRMPHGTNDCSATI